MPSNTETLLLQAIRRSRFYLSAVLILLACGSYLAAYQQPGNSRYDSHLGDPFATGWMLVDTNGDGIADAITGKIVVPAKPTASENASAANLAARLGYGSAGLTLPVVVTAGDVETAGPRIWIGKGALPSSIASAVKDLVSRLEKNEGGVFSVGDNVAIVGSDDAGLAYAADMYASRAPFQWKVPGDKLSAIAESVAAASPGSTVELTGITYRKGVAAIHRVFLTAKVTITAETLAKAFQSKHLAGVAQLVIVSDLPVSATNPIAPTPVASSAAITPPASGEPAGGADAAAPQRVDLATLYTSKGLFRGTPRMPLPSTVDAHLYVPAGAAGVAVANMAARMGMESIGITLPVASPADDSVKASDRKQSVLVAGSPLATAVEARLRSEDTAGQAQEALSAGEGELRVVDEAPNKRSAVLVRGDEGGAAAALDLASNRLPYAWEQGKQYLSLDEIRYDLHRFFSLRTGASQSAMAMYHLDRWAAEIKDAGAKNVRAEVYVDVADPKLGTFVRERLEKRLPGASVEVASGSLRAGTQCCNDKDLTLHFRSPGYEFRQAKPTFEEDLVIPWEGQRLLSAVDNARSKIRKGAPVNLLARVSEGPEQRRKLEAQLTTMLESAGADKMRSHVRVLSAYKQGFSWLMDQVAPELEGKHPASIKIEFAKNEDATSRRAMYSPARWVHELYPVDEMLARKLNVPLEKVSLNEFDPPSPGAGPTYRVEALDAAGKQILKQEFTVTTVMQPYNGTIPAYEQVQVATGWVRLESGSDVVLDARIKTDIEEFWDHYQNKTLPRIHEFIMAQSHGELKTEFAPPFDTLKLDIHMSEPDYNLDLDKERISSLEALQEDTFYNTENFVNTVANLLTGRPENYTGRIIPIVHPSEDGRDGRVHIEFYGKLAPNPLVRLTWTDSTGRRHERLRNLPALAGEMQPRLVQARVKAGQAGVERFTWLLAADYLSDQYEDWLKLDGQDQVDRNIFVVDRAKAQLQWLEQFHAAGLYRDELAYPHIQQMAMEFELPLSENDKVDAPPTRAYAAWKIDEPATRRPMIADYADPKLNGSEFVQWDEAISPAENAAILAKLATYPGITAYWAGRSYLGENIWAADVLLPSPSVLRSAAKEETLKAVIVYSGRQHANEVSSTSHIARLGQMLVTDAGLRETLKKVNVVLHPITNPDGAQLSVDLAKITPDNMLHPGYHGSLAADVSLGQGEMDPVYPESRTRKQLIDTWLPDAFLNPHGYPSHEWVQPFSEYTGWVQNRLGANPGRAWWIPRGWFTSLYYYRDLEHPYSKMVTYNLRNRIVEGERNVPGLVPLEDRMNARYERFGQRWQPRDMFQPLVNGIRIYMSLKGQPAPRPGSEAGRMGATGGVNPAITWDSAYTEAPDETARGEYMKLVASAGLAFDLVHLRYLADGNLRVSRTESETPSGVQRTIVRRRPVLPVSVVDPASEPRGQD